MLRGAGLRIREAVQSYLSKKNYTIIDFHRSARGTANEQLVKLLRENRDAVGADREFASFALEHGSDSFSQYQQESFALWAAGSKRGGTFVEFGAADGVTHSNTHMLEAKYGWTGLLIEPLPWAHAEAVRRRPNARVIQGAVDPQYGAEPKVLEFVTAGQLSTIAGYSGADKHAATRARRRKIKVSTVNLMDEIEKAIPSKVVDYMSIDVEGPEADIIAGFDFERIKVRSLSVEVNDRAEDAARISRIMDNNGFHQPFSRSVTRDDLWFVRRP